MTFKFQKPEESPGFLLWQVTNTWQRQQREALSKLNLTHAQFVVLAGVLWLNSQADSGVTQKQVSDFTKMDKMSISDLVATLLQKKMLKRQPSLRDKRAYSLSLTEKGCELVLQAIPIVEDIDYAFFSHQNTELMQFINLIPRTDNS